MTDIETVREAVKALDSKKAENIKVLKVDDITVLADYFVIANGTSSTQVKALADEVEFKLSQKGIEPSHTEGYQGNSWIVLDYIDVIVHVFYKQTREFYDLERLWQDGQQIDVKQLLEDDT